MFGTSGLSDLKITGANWTWTNRQASNLITCKLDWIVVNDDWYSLFPISSALADILILSDLSSIMVTLGKDVAFKSDSFEHFNS